MMQTCASMIGIVSAGDFSSAGYFFRDCLGFHTCSVTGGALRVVLFMDYKKLLVACRFPLFHNRQPILQDWLATQRTSSYETCGFKPPAKK